MSTKFMVILIASSSVNNEQIWQKEFLKWLSSFVHHYTVHTVTHSIIFLLMYVAYDLWDTSVSYNLSGKFPTMEFCRSGNIFLRCKKNAKDCWKICIHFLTRYCSPFFLKLLGILNCLCTISFFNSVDCVDFTFIQFPC